MMNFAYHLSHRWQQISTPSRKVHKHFPSGSVGTAGIRAARPSKPPVSREAQRI